MQCSVSVQWTEGSWSMGVAEAGLLGQICTKQAPRAPLCLIDQSNSKPTQLVRVAHTTSSTT